MCGITRSRLRSWQNMLLLCNNLIVFGRHICLFLICIGILKYSHLLSYLLCHYIFKFLMTWLLKNLPSDTTITGLFLSFFGLNLKFRPIYLKQRKKGARMLFFF